MKKALNVILIVLMTLTLAGVLAGAVLVAVEYFGDGSQGENESATDLRRLHAEGTQIKNEAGESVLLKAINAGGLFIQEGWMSPTLLSAEYGNGVPDHISMLETLRSRFGYERAKELTDIYEASFWREEDFDNVKALGFNAIRLPFAYFNLEDENGELTEFDALDRFIDGCDERDIYVVLDLHGAYGSQNGSDHSGSVEGSFLFTNEENMSKTVELWETVAARYRDRDIVAGYDLLNEPSGTFGYTNVVQFSFYDRLYEAVRKVDPDRMLIMEAVWEAKDLPDPANKLFGWENVCYSYHNYCWGEGENDFEVQKAFVDKKLADYAALSYDVPKFVGEFTCFGLKEGWEYTLNAYEEAGISYAIWTYKTVGDAGMGNWGAYSKIMSDSEKVDVLNDSYEEIAAKWSSLGTSGFTKTALYAEFI